MALLLMEGFDQYTDESEFLTNVRRGSITTPTSFATFNSLTTGRLTGKAISFDSGGNYGPTFTLDAESTDTQWVNFAINHLTPYPTTANNALFIMYDINGVVLWSLWQVAFAGTIQFRRGSSTVLGTSSNPIPLNAWANVSVEVVTHASAGTVELKINGVSEISLTSQNTLAGTGLAYMCSMTAASGSGDIYIDDVIAGDDSGSDLTAFPGDCHIEMLLPDGDGTTNDWTAVGSGTTNADRVDEAPSTDDDTTYVHSSTATDKDLYTFASLTEAGDAYYAVQPVIRARKEGAGFREINGTIRSNVTEVDGGGLPLSIDYSWVSYIEENDPDGGGAWDEAAINAMEVGLELKT